MKFLPYIASMLLAGVVSAQTIFVTTNNIFDLNPERDALSGLSGNIRIRATFTDGVSPVDVTRATQIPLEVYSTVDDYRVTVINIATNDGIGVVWWNVPFINAGDYHLRSTAIYATENVEVFDRFLTLTNVPAAAATFNITNNISADVNITNIVSSALNIYYWGTNVASITNGP